MCLVFHGFVVLHGNEIYQFRQAAKVKFTISAKSTDLKPANINSRLSWRPPLHPIGSLIERALLELLPVSV